MNSHQNHFDVWEAIRKPLSTILLVGVIFIGDAACHHAWTMARRCKLCATASIAFRHELNPDLVVRDACFGLTGYFLLWLSMVWGFAIPTGMVRPVLQNVFTYDFHEHLSLLGLGFVLVHIVVLLFDKYLPFSILQLLIPFTDTYRPFWVGLGIISFYVLLLVTFTFYLRQRIGSKAFRSIHVLSLVSYLGTTLHGFFAGTDSALPTTMLIYAGTFLVVVFLTVYWLIMRRFGKPDEHVTVTQISHRKRILSAKN